MRVKQVAFQIDLARQMETPETIKEIINVGGEMGYNELFLYGEDALELTTYPQSSSPLALKQADYIELQAHAARKYEMNLVPIIPLLGHANYLLDTEELEHLREVKDSVACVIKTSMRQFCTTNPDIYIVIEKVIDEWAKIITGPYIHIGGDESWNFAVCNNCREKADKIGRGKLLAQHFNAVNRIVKKYNKQTMIWHDMLFYYEDCLPHLDKDIIICDWHYDENIERHPGISIYNWAKVDFAKAYEEYGLSYYLAPWSKAQFMKESLNIKSLLENTKHNKPTGFLNTVWEMAKIPYASCFPSLAYGAACIKSDITPDPIKFLKEFALQHLHDELEIFPFLVELFDKVATGDAFSGLDNWITYQTSNYEILTAGKLDNAVKLVKKIEGTTKVGKDYHEAMELIFQRAAISKRLQSNINEIACEYLNGAANANTNKIALNIRSIKVLLGKIPSHIELEKSIWNKCRYKDDSNVILEQWERAIKDIGTFVNSVEDILKGKKDLSSCFPTILELTLVNNDCAWQELTISCSDDRSEYTRVSRSPQCSPFGRYIKTFKLPHDSSFIRLELAGLGQLIVHYLRVIGPGQELIPANVVKQDGEIHYPENLLVDDYRPTLIGDIETKKYLSNGYDQPSSSIEIEMLL